jgi:hypothetical protein
LVIIRKDYDYKEKDYEKVPQTSTSKDFFKTPNISLTSQAGVLDTIIILLQTRTI